MASLCQQLSNFLFAQVPQFDREFERDRFPLADTYLQVYPNRPWDPFTMTEHNYELVHVSMPNDNGCWDAMDARAFTNADCMRQPMCNPSRLEIGWGVENRTYTKYHRDYTTKPLCLDSLRHIPHAREQLGIIVSGLKKLPAVIMSDFIRLLALRQADFIYIAGSAYATVAVTDSMFTSQCSQIALGSASSLPTSKLTLQYLNHYVEQLMFNGYFDQTAFEGDAGGPFPGKFQVMTDFTSQSEMTNANPSLTQMYNAADFVKGGKFFAYGVMAGAGDWLFKIDPTPLRYTHVGGGVLKRLMPYENVSTTVGKRPRFDADYMNAPYQLSHVYARAARTVMAGETASVNSDMTYPMRNLMGKWSWKNNPGLFQYTNPTDGTLCTINNDKQNWGYFLGEFEAGMKSVHPEIEMWILHLREPSPAADVPRVSTITWPSTDGSVYQQLTPYNPGCDSSEQV